MVLIISDSLLLIEDSIFVAPMIRASTATEMTGTITNDLDIMVFPFVVSRTSHSTIFKKISVIKKLSSCESFFQIKINQLLVLQFPCFLC